MVKNICFSYDSDITLLTLNRIPVASLFYMSKPMEGDSTETGK